MRDSEIDMNLSFEQESPIGALVDETFDEADAVRAEDTRTPAGRLNAKLLVKNAKILLAAGDTALAKNIFRALIENGEMLGVSYGGLGAALELEGRVDLAIKAYREAIIYEPAIGSLSALGELYIKKEEYQNAIGTLLRANNLSKITTEQQFTIQKNLGSCYMHLGQLNNAEAHYRKAYDINPQSDALHVDIGGLAMKKGDLATALLHFKEAARINPKNASAQTGIGLANLGLGNKERAHDAFADALRIDIQETSALYNLVKCAYEMRKFEVVCDLLQEYIKNNAVNSNILYSYAGILFHRNMFQEALDECEKLLSFNPDHEGAKKIKGLIQQKTNTAQS